ncbi:MAG: hypothetical protein CMH81_06230 [Nitrospiraceae bacterium]|nr:hypothetical protein [Nitrospiraceae bacterium]|tara:strand:- start:708 stop:1409 length:702 start_codon:yes stop_codon:yes gene_type:complete
MLTVNRQTIAIGLVILVLGLGIAAFVVMEFSDTFHIPTPDEISVWVEGYGGAGPVAYLLLYTFAPMLFVPSFPISMAAGLLFGPLWGTVFASLGSTLGALLPFIIARHFARPYVARHLRGRLKDLDQKIEAHGWIYLAVTRLIPLFPFELLNYGFGLTKVRFVTYIVVSWLGMLPATIAYVFFGASMLDIVEGTFRIELVIGVVLFAVLGLLPVIYRRSRYFKPKQKPEKTIG